MGLRDERPHVAVAPPVTDLEAADSLGNPRDELVANRVDGDDGRNRHTALACRPEPGIHRRVGGQVEIRVGEHDHVVFCSSERLHSLSAMATPLIDVARDRG